MNDKIVLPVKYDIIDNCNLKCKNCDHFSQFKPKKERSVSEIEIDFKRLVDCNKFEIPQLNIFGGEPLLHSNIIGVLRTFRELLGKDVTIFLLTNGIKVPMMPESFFIALKTFNIIMSLSKYTLSNINYELIEKTFNDRGVVFGGREITEFYNFFQDVDTTGDQDAEESFKLCSVCPHTFYEDGKLYLCSYIKNVPFINSYLGYNIPHNFISIDEPVEKIREYLNHPCPTCRFCKASRQPEPWKIHGT